jgi:heme-degrading monooxygenase HmoA
MSGRSKGPIVIAIVIHEVRPGKLAAAKARTDGNTELMAAQPGFLFRHCGLRRGGEGERLVTVTGWASAADQAAWTAHKQALPPESDPDELYLRYESFSIETYDDRWQGVVDPLLHGER